MRVDRPAPEKFGSGGDEGHRLRPGGFGGLITHFEGEPLREASREFGDLRPVTVIAPLKSDTRTVPVTRSLTRAKNESSPSRIGENHFPSYTRSANLCESESLKWRTSRSSVIDSSARCAAWRIAAAGAS